MEGLIVFTDAWLLRLFSVLNSALSEPCRHSVCCRAAGPWEIPVAWLSPLPFPAGFLRLPRLVAKPCSTLCAAGEREQIRAKLDEARRRAARARRQLRAPSSLVADFVSSLFVRRSSMNCLYFYMHDVRLEEYTGLSWDSYTDPHGVKED